MTPNVVALAGLVMLVVALELQVRVVEEPYLRQAHERAYEDYAGTTGRFVPASAGSTAQTTGPGSGWPCHRRVGAEPDPPRPLQIELKRTR